MMDWKPIETAPTNGTPILLFCPGIGTWNRKEGMPDIVVGLWEWEWHSPGERGNWFSDVGDIQGGYESTGDYFEHEPLRPTHWQPLPLPPES